MPIAARSNYANVLDGRLDPLWWYGGSEAGSRQAQADNRIGAEDDPAGGSFRVQRYTIQPGDFTNFGGSRCEVLSGQITLNEGQRGQLLFGVYLAAGFNSSGSGWNSLTDFHYPNNGPAQSPFTMSIRNGTQLYVNIKGGPISSDGTRGTVEVDRFLITLTRQTWYTILIDLKQGGSSATGDCNIWVNGTLVFSGARPTITSGVPNSVYIKQGFYHSLSDQSYDPKTMWCLDTIWWRNNDASEALTYLGAPPAPVPPPGPPPPLTTLWPVSVSGSSRYLLDQNNAPWMMVGDSPQDLISNVSLADMAVYFDNRQAKGFNAVWVNMWTGSGLHGRANLSTYDGITPFTTPGDISTPREAYFARVDAMMQLAKDRGITVLLNPIETHDNLALIQSSGQTKCFNYGVYVGNRYKNFPNLIWFLGNDFATYVADDQYLTKVSDGIASVDPAHLQTVEMMQGGAGDSVASSVDPNWNTRVDLDSVYTYGPTYELALVEYGSGQGKPTFMVEANYETENNTGGPTTTDETIRRQIYWSMLSGCTGHLYGHRATVFFEPLFTNAQWKAALNTNAAGQVKFATDVFKARNWHLLVPDPTHTFCTAGYGTRTTTGDVLNSDYATAALNPDGSLGMVYTPTARSLTIDMTKMSGSVNANWFDPRSGNTYAIAGSPFPNTGTRVFTTIGNHPDGTGDWLLILESSVPAPPSPLFAYTGNWTLDAVVHAPGALAPSSFGDWTLAKIVRSYTPAQSSLFQGTWTAPKLLLAPQLVPGTGNDETTVAWHLSGLTVAGTIGVRVIDNVGGTPFPRNTAIVIEYPAGSGIYSATIPNVGVVGQPLGDPGQYTIVFDDGTRFDAIPLVVGVAAGPPPPVPTGELTDIAGTIAGASDRVPIDLAASDAALIDVLVSDHLAVIPP